MSTLYTKAKNKFLTAGINWNSDAIKVALVDSANYVPNVGDDEFLSVIPASSVIAKSDNLTGKTVAEGAADADDVTLEGVSGARFEYLVLYKDTGSNNTSPLIALIDSATNLPYTPSGGSVLIQWDNGTNKVLRIG